MFYMVCTIVPVFTVDRLGRRFTLFYGAVLQGICLILVAVLTKPDIMGMNPGAFGISATVFTFGYTGVFGMTWLCVPWLYPVSVILYLVWSGGVGVARGEGWLCIGEIASKWYYRWLSFIDFLCIMHV